MPRACGFVGTLGLPLQQAAINAGDISLRNALRESLEGLPALVACFSNACRNAARLPVAVPVVAPAGIPKCGLVSRGRRGADGSRMGAPIGLVELRRCVA